MADDILINKAQTIERCIRRIREVYGRSGREFANSLDIQDVIILNLQRACEAALDMAVHLVRKKRLGAPQNSRDFFNLLESHQEIPVDLSQRMKAMIGFRNIAVHDYQKLNLEIVRAILEKHLEDFTRFSSHVLRNNP